MIVVIEVSSYQSIYISIFDIFVIFHQLACRAIIYMIAHALFCFYLVTIGYGYIIHLIAETDDQHILRVSPTCANTHPDSNLMQCFFFFPVAYHYFATDAHTGTDMSELAVAVS